MRRALFALALLGCSSKPPPPVVVAKAAPKVVAPLRVRVVLRHSGDDGFLVNDTPFAVVLTQPVDAVPNVLSLVTDDGAKIAGATAWLHPQLVAFYPSEPLPNGLDLELRLVSELRSHDGAVLAPGILASSATAPLKCKPWVSPNLEPMEALRFSSEVPLPAAEVERLGSLIGAAGPIPFSVTTSGTLVDISAKRGLPPGDKVTFSFPSGPLVKTSRGRMLCEPFSAKARKGFSLRHLGEYADKCKASFPKNVYTQVCDADVIHLAFSTPLAPDSAKKHLHPPMAFATTGDTRGHRLELTLSKTPMKVVIDQELEDIFGQKFTSRLEVVLIRKAP